MPLTHNKIPCFQVRKNKVFRMNMSFVFWIVTVSMAVIALLFLLVPIVRKQQKISATAWLAVIAIPLLAIGLYVVLGQPDAADYVSGHAQSVPANATSATPPSGNLGSVQSMLTGLEERLREDPSDAKGWLLLAKSYSHLGRDDDAALAYAKASELGLADTDFQAKLDGAPSSISGTAVIRGRLTVAESAKERLSPGDSIFIFAKSTDGSPMPVAVLRKVAADLPFDFELSDKQAMSTAAKLSTTATVIITARVSKSGNAMQAEPGLEVISEIINVGDDTLVELHLDPSKTLDES